MADESIPETRTDDKPMLADVVEQFATFLESGDDDNVSRFLNERMCCDGHMCGCYGSSVGEYLAYQLREAVKRLA